MSGVKVKDIDTVLPQTQCQECGYAGCLPYAEALACGSTAIDKCPPGGETVVNKLAALLNIDPMPYLEKARQRTRLPALAKIKEEDCIGCTKCIQACPVDAIIGTAKRMHVVLTHECTGCGLCVDPCPVDCIEMLPLEQPAYQPETAKTRFQARQARLLQAETEKQQAYQEKRRLVMNQSQAVDLQAKRDYILQIMKKKQNGS